MRLQLLLLGDAPVARLVEGARDDRGGGFARRDCVLGAEGGSIEETMVAWHQGLAPSDEGHEAGLTLASDREEGA